ncbi:MAG: carbohydrate porin, partial [Chamaesiphon sp.]|nr:carbohydrate porin [Chamaesiphon sp.]
MFDRTINWLSITSGSLLATLLIITSAQAADTISASNRVNSTLDLHSPNQLIALRNKKRLKRKVKFKPNTTATTSSTIPAPINLTQITPPPAPIAPPTSPAVTPTAPPTATPADPDPNQFSLNTKLQGSVIFGATGTFAGDYNRNPAFGNRTRLELKTEIGTGTLTTRLQAVGLGLNTQNPSVGTTATATNEGSLSWTDGTTNSSIGIDALKYEFPLTPKTQLVVAANAGAADDFTDTINPYFDGDGASGSISTFGNRPSIYYTVQ